MGKGLAKAAVGWQQAASSSTARLESRDVPDDVGAAERERCEEREERVSAGGGSGEESE